jgi:hypothetical protein
MDEQTKRLLREGFYWEALRLPPGSPYPMIVKRIAEMEQSCHGDREALTLLDEARQGLRSGNYPAARRFCDDVFSKLDDQFSQRIFGEAVISREGFWQELIRPRLHTFSDDPDGRDIKHILADTIFHIGVTLVNKAQEKLVSNSITSSTAIRAINKGIRALEIAQIYSDNPEPAGEQLKTAKKLTSSLYCNRGVQRINKAQEDLNTKLKKMSPDDIMGVEFRNALNTAITETQEAIADIEKAQQMDSEDSHVQEQLEIANDLLNRLDPQRVVADSNDVPIPYIQWENLSMPSG